MANKFAVIGLGRLGFTVATQLSSKGFEVLAIDKDEDRTDTLRDEVAFSVTMDSTDIKALKSQHLDEMDAVVVAIGRDFEALLLTTVHLMDLKVKRIIARAINSTQKMILEKMGIQEIISPEEEVGISIAERLLYPGMLTFLQLPDSYEIVEIQAPPNITNRTIADINLRQRYHLNLITVKRCELKGDNLEEHIIGVPNGETILQKTDTIILLGKAKDIKRFIEINN